MSFNKTDSVQRITTRNAQRPIKDEGENLNLIYLSLDETKIDITEEVKEYCMLAIPLKLLCKEDCKGLCSSCGINLNLETCNCKKESYNPIWDKLNKLKE